LCIALSNGDLIVYNTETQQTSNIASLENGISTIAANADQDLIVVVTNDDTFILFDNLFDKLCEKNIHPTEFGCGEAVTVGWGSKETQFHGSEGKQAAKKKVETIDPALPYDDKKVRVEWKSDGLYFAISAIDPSKLCRKIRIWSREGELQYTSEIVNGLEHLIAWKPSSNLIVSSQQLINKHDIIFFEKNGLRHGEFSILPVGFSTVDHISWSPDGKVLLVAGRKFLNDTQKTFLTLWSSSNYYWYQKQTFEFENKINSVLWESGNFLKLLIIKDGGEFIRFEWSWEVTTFEDIVAVIDGSNLLISSFRYTVIPPPMFTYKITFDKPLNQISLAGFGILSMQNDGKLIMCTPSEEEKYKSFLRSFNSEVHLDGNDGIKILEKFVCEKLNYTVHHLTLVGCDIFMIVSANNLTQKLIKINNKMEILQLKEISSPVYSICSHNKHKILAIQLYDCSILQYQIAEDNLLSWVDDDRPVVFPENCPTMKITSIGEKIKIFALSERFSLYCSNTKLLTNSCISFAFYKEKFILLTTSDHFLRCWPLDSDLEQKMKQKIQPENEEHRRIERGAKIITCVSNEAKVILQMPRGNLETVFPRVLLLDEIKQLLDKNDYKSAFKMMKKNRINLNLLVDHDIHKFLDNIETFVEQLSNSDVNDICIFLSELIEEDVCNSMYSYSYTNRSNLDLKNSKLDIICDKMKQVLINTNPKKYFLPFLVTLLKKSKPEIGNALKEIKELKNSNERDSALKYLLYLIDFNKLYDEALGTYDMDIVLLVAQKSNKDPKEYLALINRFKNIEPPYYRNFKIDLHLKRYEKALFNISLCDGDNYFEESLELIEKHHLFREAIKLYSGHNKKIIWKKFGQFLLIKKYFEEAAVAFKLGDDFHNALKAYQLSGNWNAALDLASTMHDLNHKSFYRSMADSLTAENKHLEAAYIYETLLENIDEAATVCIKGHHWDSASRFLHHSTNSELFVYFKDNLFDHFDTIISFIEKSTNNLQNYTKRFIAVKKNKIESLNQINETYDQFADTYSDTSSIADSNSISGTFKTRRTSRNTKKQERKKYILKEGGANEYEALMFTIKEIIEKVNDVQEEVGLLIRTLFSHGFEEKASCIQNSFSKLMHVIDSTISCVWPENSSDTDTVELVKRQFLNESFDLKLLVPPLITKVNWKFALLLNEN
ncbi:elongator complex protein 1-like protein, partial [Dinothrombium tinctorium]